MVDEIVDGYVTRDSSSPVKKKKRAAVINKLFFLQYCDSAAKT